MAKNIKVSAFNYVLRDQSQPKTAQHYLIIEDGMMTPSNLLIVSPFMNEKALIAKLKDEYGYGEVTVSKNASNQISEWENNLFPKKATVTP